MRLISDYELSRTIVASRSFGAYPMADSYRALAGRFGHDFGPSIALLERLPTFIDGEVHRTMREAMARVFAAIRQPQLAVAKDYLAAFGAEWLQPGRRLDLMGDFARPLFKAMSEIAVATRQIPDAAVALVDELPLLFSPFTPLKVRLEINQRLGAVIDNHGEQVMCDIGLLVLGVRPLTGGLAGSLHAAIAAHPGHSFNAMPWPARLTSSPVTYVDRICLEPMTIGDEQFAVGDHLRCQIQPTDWTSEQRQSTMFGVGTHLCLGRPISEQIWALAVDLFAAQALCAVAEPIEMKPGSDPFDLPARCPIAIEG